MDRRTNESPMDFEWERKEPLNPDSPWLKHTAGSASNSFRAQSNSTPPTKQSAILGVQSIFNTPSKQPLQSQNPPFFGSSSRSTTAPVPPTYQNTGSLEGSRTTLFSEFRTPNTAVNSKDPFGSFYASKTSTTHHDTDDTAPSHHLHGLRLTDSAREKILSTTTERAVSGRGELRRGKFTEASSKRVHKRKRDIWGNGVSSPRQGGHGSRSDYGATSDEDTSDEVGPKKPQESINTAPKRSKWDHHFPILVSSYLQLLFNIFIVMLVLYLIVSFVRTIQADVDTKVKQFSAQKQSDIEDCSHQFRLNLCSGYRPPAMEEMCTKWEACMKQDPDEVGRAKISAQTFAEILNSLIEPISYKAMIFCLAVLFGSLWITNAAFGLYRSRMNAGHPPDSYVPPAHTQAHLAPMHHAPAPWPTHHAFTMPVHSSAPGINGMDRWAKLAQGMPPQKFFGAGEGVKQLEN